MSAFLSRHRLYLLSLGWIAAVFAFLQLFRVFDYGAGRQRFVVLLAIPAVAYGFRRLARPGPRDAAVDARWAREMRLVFIIGATFLALLAGQTFAQARSMKAVHSDQAQGISRALELMRLRANPYGPTTFLQPHDFGHDLTQFESLGCGSVSESRAWVEKAWVERGAALLAPVLPDPPGFGPCEAVFRRLHSMGFRYGPVILAFYAPFVAALWESGFILAHALLMVIGLAFLIPLVKKQTGSLFAASAVGVLLVWTRPMRWEIFIQAHSDLLPTALAFAFYFLRRGERPMLAALAIGLSIGAKPLPGLIWLPLLAREPRALLLAVGVVAASFAPFIAWDPAGFWNNLSYPFLNRYTDSTAVAHYLPPPARKALSLAALGFCAGFGWRWLKKGGARAELDYLLVAHVAVLVSGTVFHNNYLVWLMPLMALVLMEPFRGNPVPPISAPNEGRT